MTTKRKITQRDPKGREMSTLEEEIFDANPKFAVVGDAGPWDEGKHPRMAGKFAQSGGGAAREHTLEEAASKTQLDPSEITSMMEEHGRVDTDTHTIRPGKSEGSYVVTEKKRKSQDSAPSWHTGNCMLTDSVTLDDAAKVRFTGDGYLVASPRVARTGIQLYKGDECGRPDLDIVRVFRPQDEVFHSDALKSYAHKPVTLDHPSVPVTAKNWKKLAVGQTGDEVLRDGNTIRIPMVLMDAAAIQAFKDGKNQLSLGYTCDLDWKAGTTADGEPYDAVQRGIRANHLAVVAAARGGSALRIGDDDGNNGDIAMNMKTVVVDGIECQMTDTAAALVERTLRDAQKRIADAEKERDDEKKKAKEACDAAANGVAIIATKDAEIVTLKKQLSDAEMTPAKLDALVKDRAEVVAKAKSLVGDKLTVDGATIADIRRQTVKALVGDASKDWSDEQVLASFNTLSASVKAKTGNSINDAVRVFSGSHVMSDSQMDDAETIKDKAHAEYVNRLTHAWQGGQSA